MLFKEYFFKNPFHQLTIACSSSSRNVKKGGNSERQKAELFPMIKQRG